MFSDYDSFVLVQAIPGEDIPVGAVGVVLLVLDSGRRIYEVEFPDKCGISIGRKATYTISEEYMRAVDW